MSADRLGLEKRVADLERELSAARRKLGDLGVQEAPRTLHLVLSAQGIRAALPASAVKEIFRLVATVPLPDAPAWVLGTFLCRGTPYTAIDLGKRLGRPGPPSISSHLLLLDGPDRLAIVVDEVSTLTEAAQLLRSESATGLHPVLEATSLTEGLVRTDAGVIALLSVKALSAAVGPSIGNGTTG